MRSVELLPPIFEDENVCKQKISEQRDPLALMVIKLLQNEFDNTWASSKVRASEYLRVVLIFSGIDPITSVYFYHIARIRGVWEGFSQMRMDAAYALGLMDITRIV